MDLYLEAIVTHYTYWIIGIICWAILARMGWRMVCHISGVVGRQDDEWIAMHTIGPTFASEISTQNDRWLNNNPSPDYGIILGFLSFISVIPVLIVVLMIIFIVGWSLDLRDRLSRAA